MPKAYYTLCVWDSVAGAWFDEFGDYSRKLVESERAEHSAKGKHKVVIKTDGTAPDMIAKRDALPSPK